MKQETRILVPASPCSISLTILFCLPPLRISSAKGLPNKWLWGTNRTTTMTSTNGLWYFYYSINNFYYLNGCSLLFQVYLICCASQTMHFFVFVGFFFFFFFFLKIYLFVLATLHYQVVSIFLQNYFFFKVRTLFSRHNAIAHLIHHSIVQT